MTSQPPPVLERSTSSPEFVPETARTSSPCWRRLLTGFLPFSPEILSLRLCPQSQTRSVHRVCQLVLSLPIASSSSFSGPFRRSRISHLGCETRNRTLARLLSGSRRMVFLGLSWAKTGYRPRRQRQDPSGHLLTKRVRHLPQTDAFHLFSCRLLPRFMLAPRLPKSSGSPLFCYRRPSLHLRVLLRHVRIEFLLYYCRPRHPSLNTLLP